MNIELNKVYNMDCIEGMRMLGNESVDMVITSPPYYGLRDYGTDSQIGQEQTFADYLDNLVKVFEEVYRVLKNNGSLWVNISDVYAQKNTNGIKKQSLMCLPDRLKIRLLDIGFICRNEIIWHKPNAMPSSAKNRFNIDYEKLFFFTKSANYYFDTQYEAFKSKVQKSNANRKRKDSKYFNDEQEKSVRQGMSKSRGTKTIEVRNHLPQQEVFVDFMRKRVTIDSIVSNCGIKRTKVEHWFRKDKSGFAYPSVVDWNTIKYLVDDWSKDFEKIDYGLTKVDYETDDILKNAHKGRIKRSVWSINTRPFKGCHFAPYPTKLVETPIKASCPINGIVLDPFMGSGTTAVVCKELSRNYIGFEISSEYCEIAKKRTDELCKR